MNHPSTLSPLKKDTVHAHAGLKAVHESPSCVRPITKQELPSEEPSKGQNPYCGIGIGNLPAEDGKLIRDFFAQYLQKDPDLQDKPGEQNRGDYLRASPITKIPGNVPEGVAEGGEGRGLT